MQDDDVTFDDMTKALGNLIKRFKRMDDKISTIESKLDKIESKVDKMEKNTDLTEIRRELSRLRSDTDVMAIGHNADDDLHTYLVEESIKEAQDKPMSKSDIAEGLRKYGKAKYPDKFN